MRKRTMGNTAIVTAALLATIGVGVAVASAATSQPDASASASAAPSVSSSVTASSRPTASTSASASASASSSSDGSECANVFLTTDPAGDKVGKLCTVVTGSGTSVDSVATTFTPSSSCSGSITMRVAGADKDGAEFAEVKTVTCGSDAVTATFEPVTAVASDTFLCGMLLAEKYTAAQACVAIS